MFFYVVAMLYSDVLEAGGAANLLILLKLLVFSLVLSFVVEGDIAFGSWFRHEGLVMSLRDVLFNILLLVVGLQLVLPIMLHFIVVRSHHRRGMVKLELLVMVLVAGFEDTLDPGARTMVLS